MAKKYCYLFTEGNANMRELLGGKGANLAEMTNIGLPVPQGFTISTEACTQYYEDGKQIGNALQLLHVCIERGDHGHSDPNGLSRLRQPLQIAENEGIIHPRSLQVLLRIHTFYVIEVEIADVKSRFYGFPRYVAAGIHGGM